MAKKRTSTTGVLINGDLEPKAANPHSWLPLIGDPAGTDGLRILYGVLRPDYRGWTNTAALFARRKIEVGLADDPEPWTQGAARIDVLLPDAADDCFLSPRVLMEAIDSEPIVQPYLLTYVTFTFATDRLHTQWELVRRYARDHLVGELGAGVLVIQHAPNRSGYGSLPHVHLLVTRKVTSLGLAEPVSVLTGDKGRQLIVEAFASYAAELDR
ncbi:hypothetical protein [Stakelama saccharophila]|uniref:MobA/MobL protein domain-containing protein n=1 Tax=Stakelama saccharophila TaxID=3075605 RepID=A0ABZ0B975_9SPHN|nr:hypothetical protein [Stakelama sp. W311]WNO53171.1 hypothetical protein RPR59_12050 [Stakelama sp. W311]